MRCEWKIYTLNQTCTNIYSGGTPSTKQSLFWNGDVNWLSSSETSKHFIYDTKKKITSEGVKFSATKKAQQGSIIVASAGQGYTRGQVSYLMIDTYVSQSVLVLVPKQKIILPLYLYYNLTNRYQELRQLSDGTSTRGGLSGWIMKRMEIRLPSITIQQKIVEILYDIDKRIELNRQINANLEQQVLAYYNYLFIDNYNVNRRKCRMNEYFDISIGKTPPRQETQWFKTQSNDVVWVSISDMAKCGLYINKSSEQLTKEAIKKFNIPVVPDNTLLLSFKLTIGRIAITNGELATNEAIAHFKTDQKIINEYLYCYLKRFDYDKMGNTSSIAVALNSRLIKEMPFIIPESHELQTFYDYAHCRFQYIKANLSEINALSTLRDTLLPKLMSGEVDVSKIELG